jgi:hypothetical protein
MSRPISDILLDSVGFLNLVKDGTIQPQSDDVERNIQFLKNVIANEGLTIREDVKISCEKIIKTFEENK